MSTKKGLGRGLGALLGDTALQMEENAADPALISIYKIEPNPLQPRKQFDELELQALADSITANGLIQPLAPGWKRSRQSSLRRTIRKLWSWR